MVLVCNEKKEYNIYIYMKSLLKAINEAKESEFSLTELDQKIFLAMVEYFYDNSQAKALLVKKSNANSDFNIKFSSDDLEDFLETWDHELGVML